MAISIQRRKAFENVFKLYPVILFKIVASDDTHLVHPVTKKHESIVDTEMRANAGLVFMAQFVTRLLRTRCHNSRGAKMSEFAEHTAERYRFYLSKLLLNREIYIDAKKAAALAEFEEGMVNVIFEALATEVEIYEAHALDGISDEDDFHEPDFWIDVMMALGARQFGKDEPYWMLAIQEIALNHKAEFVAALEDENG